MSDLIRILLLLAALTALACSSQTNSSADQSVDVTLDLSSADAGSDSEVSTPDAADSAENDTDAGDPDSSETTPPEPLKVSDDFDESFNGYPDDQVVTTLLQTLHPKYGYVPYLNDEGYLLTPEQEFGKLYKQPGEPHVLRDDLGLSPQPGKRRSIAYIFALGDPQVIDPESPATIASNKLSTGGISAYHHSYPFLTHLTDAVVQTARRFSIDRPYDFALVLGDLAANAQLNELEWALRLLSGGRINPDTGGDEDPTPGPVNDVRDPYDANGLGVPWYAALGNHDVLVNGVWPIGLIEEMNTPEFEKLAKIIASFGLGIPGIGTADFHRAFIPPDNDPALLLDPDAFTLDLFWDDQELASLTEKSIIPDPQRKFVTPCELIEMLRNDNGTPKGHGYSDLDAKNCTRWFVVDPVSSLPLRLIVLDLNSYIGGSEGFLTPPLNPDGTVIEEQRGNPLYDQIAWLNQQLERAKTDGVAVLIASHHISSSLRLTNQARDFESLLNLVPDLKKLAQKWMPDPAEAMSSAEFRKLLASYPNVIAHLAGHWHTNRIHAVCPDGTMVSPGQSQSGKTCTPGTEDQRGYYEILAPSPIGYPPQGRIVEIVDNGDGSGSIFTTIIDAQGGKGSLFERGRLLQLAERQATSGGRGGLGSLYDRNTELVFKWVPAVAEKLKALTLPEKIESLSTLKQPAPGLPRLPLAPVD